jgi:hypothetical protein
MIRVRFVTTEDPVSAGISFAEYGFWATHAEAVMPDGTLLGAHYDGGVQARPSDYDKGKFKRQGIVEIPADDTTTNRFHAFMTSQVGKPYDITAIAAFVARRDWREPDSWFCSELVAAGLEDAGWFAAPLATEVNHLTPRDLLLIISGRVAITF